jgi:hypothetical protein
MWALIVFALFSVAVCVVAFLRGASITDAEELSPRESPSDSHRRNAA